MLPTPFLLPRPAQALPLCMIKPPVRVLWWPIADHSGTPTAGTESSSGLAVNGQTAGVSITKKAVLGVNAAGATWHPTGGITQPDGSAAYFDVVPTGDELTFLQTMLDLSGLVEGETIMVGAELLAPAGWAAAHATSHTVLSFGNFAAASASGGVDFGISGVERPQVLVWAKGATAQLAPVTPIGGFLQENTRNVIVWEITCTEPGWFKARSHVGTPASGVSSSGWTTAVSWADAANGGTAAPGAGGFGIRMFRRNGSTTNQANKGETHRNVWVARLNEETEGVAKRLCLEMLLTPNNLPRWLRTLAGDAITYTGPDGNANKTFGDIALEDMFVYLDGATPFSQLPEMTIEVEQPVTPSVSKISIITTHQQYSSDANAEGLLRMNPALGNAYKFGRFKTGPFANAVLFSGHKDDISNRGRAECTWQGPAVTLPLGVDFWMAGRLYLDFPPPDVGQLVIMQLFPGYSGTGMFPMWTFELDTTNKRFIAKYGWTDEPDSIQSDIVRTDVEMPGYGPGLFQRWFDLIVKHRIHWDAAQSPRTEIWLDGVKILDRAEPYGYRGPSGQNGKSLDPFARCGIYPPSPYLTPNTTRDVYVSRFFVAKNVGNYPEYVVRDALTAPAV